MKIDFIASNQNFEVGSFRIWVKSLSDVLNKKGFDTKIVTNITDTRHDACLIFSKGDIIFSDLLIKDSRFKGAININRNSHKEFDFIICGSIEEKKSLELNYKNVFIINLIENIHKNFSLKQHISNKDLTIGYHGNSVHLKRLNHGFVEAFNEVIESGINLKFLCISNDIIECRKTLIEIGLKKDVIECRKWNINKITEDIRDIDIGIVPNISFENNINFFDNSCGLYDSDYIFRLKNKSNPGRAFVFIQHGVPVITDLTPSYMPIYFDELAGSIAICQKTWKEGIIRFIKHEERNKVAKFAYDRFISLYSFENDVDKLIEFIKETCK